MRDAVREDMETPVIVWKVGGSLLSLPDLASRLRRVMRQRPATRPLLVVGGGAAADIVRDWDAQHGLGDECSHWLALQSLRLNESLVEALLPAGRSVGTRDEAARVWQHDGVPIIRAVDFVRHEEQSSTHRMPHCWDVTSDSVAAWIALTWPAGELILLKSVGLPNARDLDTLIATGSIDAYFSNVAANLPKASWCNLRESADVTGWIE